MLNFLTSLLPLLSWLLKLPNSSNNGYITPRETQFLAKKDHSVLIWLNLSTRLGAMSTRRILCAYVHFTDPWTNFFKSALAWKIISLASCYLKTGSLVGYRDVRGWATIPGLDVLGLKERVWPGWYNNSDNKLIWLHLAASKSKAAVQNSRMPRKLNMACFSWFPTSFAHGYRAWDAYLVQWRSHWSPVRIR